MALKRILHSLPAAALGLLGSVALAHHPILGKFDENASKELTGVVTKVDWRNPHAHLFVNVPTEDGGIENWAVELESPIILRQSGWDRDTVQAGDRIMVDGITARNGSRQVWGENVRLTSTKRRVFTVSDDQPVKPLASRPAPRWPDGRPALGAVPGSSGGYWSFPTANVLMEDGVEAEMNPYGQLANIEDAGGIAPFQPWAEALYEHRQERQLQDDPMYLHCKPPGGPRQFQSRLGVQLIEDRDKERVFVLLGSGNHNYRIMYLDDRDFTGQVGGDDDNPLYYGRSVGQWQDGTLVVSTRDFNEDFWFSNGGLPHTSMLELTERFTRLNQDTLEYEVTIDDPGAYTRPWTATWTLTWVGGEELPYHLCQENRP